MNHQHFSADSIINYYHNHKINKSPYSKIKKKYEEDLSQANFSGDWRSRQDITLKILWLESYYKVKSQVLNQPDNDSDKASLIASFREVDIKFPLKWKLDDYYCYPFSEEIVAAYRKILVDNAHQGMYKSNNTLPLPKEYILKAIYFILDYVKQKKPMYNIYTDKSALVDNLNTIKAFLYLYFIDTGDDDLPTEAIANSRIGKVYKDAQENHDHSDDLKLMNWRSITESALKDISPN